MSISPQALLANQINHPAKFRTDLVAFVAWISGLPRTLETASGTTCTVNPTV